MAKFPYSLGKSRWTVELKGSNHCAVCAAVAPSFAPAEDEHEIFT